MEICSLSIFFSQLDFKGHSWLFHTSQTQHKYRSYRNWKDPTTGGNLPLTNFILCCKHAINFSPWLLLERILHGFRAHLSVSEAFSLRKVFDFKNDFLVSSSALCSLTQLLSKAVWSHRFRDAEQIPASGTRHQIVPVAAFNATRANRQSDN